MDAAMIKDAILTFIGTNPKSVFEIRIPIKGQKKTASGYYDIEHIDTAIKDIESFNGKYNIYFTFNELKPELLARTNNNINPYAESTTNDDGILRRRWLMIDFDPVRVSDISSSDEEKEKAKKKAMQVKQFLGRYKFPEPIVCDSGNGWHLLYGIDLENSKANTELIKSVLEVLSMLFDDGSVSVDKSVFNAARITKLYGTTAVKGQNMPDRPHRQSSIIEKPKEVKNITMMQLEEIAALLQKPEPPKQYGNKQQEFDLDNWLYQYGVQVEKKVSCSEWEKYVLDVCPFNNDHKAPDAAIFKFRNGAIAFKCFHNSCQDHKWQDLRQKYEPGCYDKPEYDRDKYKLSMTPQKHSALIVKDDNPIPTGTDRKAELEKMLLRVKDIKPYDKRNTEIIPSGIPTLDKKIGGYEMGQLTIWTGVNGGGKSILLSQTVLEALDHGYRVFAFSGELRADKFQYWADLQAAGSEFVEWRTSKEGNEYPIVKYPQLQLIHEWYGDNFFLHDNSTMKIEIIMELMEYAYEYKTCRIFLIDNLMRLDIKSMDREKYEAQSKLMNALADFAKQRNVCVHVAAHPRKVFGSIISKMDIAGSGDLTNAADNVLAVHRVNDTFKREFEKLYGKKQVEKLEGVTNMVEIFKARESGAEDDKIPLKHCMDTKRLIDISHPELEYRKYGWLPDSYEAPVKECEKENLLDWIEDDQDCPF